MPWALHPSFDNIFWRLAAGGDVFANHGPGSVAKSRNALAERSTQAVGVFKVIVIRHILREPRRTGVEQRLAPQGAKSSLFALDIGEVDNAEDHSLGGGCFGGSSVAARPS